MGLLRAPDGSIVDVPDAQSDMFRASGYEPVDAGSSTAMSDAMARPDSGALSGIGALASSTLSGATLGLSDVALRGLLNRGDFERLATDRELHPVLSGVGQMTGTLLPMFAAPGSAISSLPAGAVSRTAMGATEAARELGGAQGALAALGVSGVEGSIYNAGAYLSDTALGDRELSAEGLAGALGSGFEFGAAGGVAAMGIERGSMAARRMFSRLTDGGKRAYAEAEQAWLAKYQSTLEANDAAAEIARAKLAEAQLARQQADVMRQNAAAQVATAKAAAPAMDAAAAAEQQAASIAGMSDAERAAGLIADRGHVALAGGDTGVMSDIERQLKELAGRDPRTAAALGLGGEPLAAPLSPAAAEDLAAAVAEHDAARAELDDILRRIESPDVGQAGGAIGQNVVPIGEFGAPGARGFKTQGELGRLAEGSAPRAAGTPAEAAPQAPATAVGKRRTPAAPTTPFDFAESELKFDPAARSYRFPTPEAAAEGESAAREAIREGSVLEPRAEPSGVSPGDFEPQVTNVGRRPTQGVPEYGAIRAHEAKFDDYLEQAVPARSIADRGYYEPPGVVQVRRSGERTMEARMPDGSVRVLDETKYEPDDFLESLMPDGFRPTKVRTSRDFEVSHRIPATAADVNDNAIIIATPSELVGRKVIGNQLHDDHMESILRAWKEGKRLDAIDAFVMPDGAIYIEDGNHRLQAAARTNREVALRFRNGEGYRPQSGARDIGARVRAELPRTSAAPDGLLAALQGTSAKLGEGRSIAEIGASSPARAEYVANKAARTEEAAAHFREQAIAKRYAGSEMAAAEREMQAGHPLAVQQLERAHETAVERAASATTAAERVAAEREVASIEHQLSRVGARPGVVEDIAAAAEVVTKYEKASAKLAEALGDAAPPAAKEAAAAVREAEQAAERKTMARTTRAIDDHAEQQAAPRQKGDWKRDAKVQQHARGQGRPMSIEEWRAKYPARAAGPIDAPELNAPRGGPAGGLDIKAPTKLPGQQYIDAAKAGKTHTDAAFARARAAEAEAKYGADRAKMTADKLRAEADAARPSMPEPAGKGKLATIATVVGVAGELGIPGIPKPHDIPVVGPLLGALIKYKAIKAAAGRFVGRVPATTDARVAALAARTKDGIARAVDRTLGLAAKPAMRTAVVVTSAVLGHRLFDDGEPDAPKGATPQQMAAVRIREIAAAAARPELVVQHVRKQLHGVTDPDLIAAAENHMVERFQYLASVMPKMPPADPLSKTEWLPSPAATSDLAQRLAVVNDPVHAFDNPTPATIDAAQRMNPQLFAMAKQRVMERLSDIKSPLPYAAKLKAAMLYGSELLVQSMSPPALAVLQATHAQVRAEAAPKPMSPPTPSIAAPADLNQMYDPGNQRRAARM